MRILVVNAGSSSLKLRILDDDDLVASRDLPRPDASTLRDSLGGLLDAHPGVEAVGHRVVHGGSIFDGPLLLDAQADEELAALADLAPLHNPIGLGAITAVMVVRPDLPQVACFDTTFHRDMPAKAYTYAVPRAWREQWGIRRFGFHGLSHAWATRRAAALIGRPAEELRLVTAHLGSGASLAAVVHGRSVDTTMGFTPMEGLVMATRSGSVDPGLVLWVERHGGLSADEVELILERESGLAGLWEGSADLRDVMVAMDAGDRAARLAYEVYVYRIQTNVGAMCAAMNGLDGLVFTGGAGEAEPRLRMDICDGLAFLGLELESVANGIGGDDRRISVGDAPAVVVVHAREDLEIARHVREMLTQGS
jgi:acetate kinase